MTTTTDSSRASHMHYYTTTTDDDQDIDEQDIIDSDLDHEDDEEHTADDDPKGQDNKVTRGCCRPTAVSGGSSKRRGWWLGRVLDPREKWVQEWNRVFLLVCAAGLFVDPLFFYALSMSNRCMCLFVDGWFAVTVTVLRCMTDALHVWNMWLHLKMAKRAFGLGATAAVGGDAAGLRDISRRSVALGYLKGRRGFYFDLFVIVPIPQVRIFCFSNFSSVIIFINNEFCHVMSGGFFL